MNFIQKLRIALAPFKTANFFSRQNQVQCGVSIVLGSDSVGSPQSLADVSMLLIQRANAAGDINSGDLAFPGGKCDDKESSYDASIRQTIEEVGLDLTQHSQYLGQLGYNYMARYLKNNKVMLVAPYVFYLKGGIRDIKLTGCSREVKTLSWVKLDQLVNPDNFTQFSRTFKGASKQFQNSWMAQKSLLDGQVRLQSLTGIEFPGVNLGMQRPLWGLTFGMAVMMMRKGMPKSDQLHRLQLHSSRIDLKFKQQVEEADKKLIQRQIVNNYFKYRVVPVDNATL